MNFVTGDLTKMSVDCIMNAANGIGPMGRGIAGALKRAGGEIVQHSATESCMANSFLTEGGTTKVGHNFGTAYLGSSGHMAKNGVKKIVHAVTMHTPQSPTSVEICRAAFNSALVLAVKEGYKSIGVPALGTGVGGLDKKEIAEMMVSEAKKYEEHIDITFADIDGEFVDYCKQANGF